jgi:hypothetical protein
LDPAGQLLEDIIRLLRERRGEIEAFVTHQEASFLALA